MANKELDYSNYKTDKVRNHSYMPVYERIFSDLRRKKVNLLEIGVYTGGCLCMWRDFFLEGSDIEGVDIHCASLDRASLGDIIVHDVDIMEWSTDKIYDIIIDDASHEAHEQASTLKNLWKNVSKRGMYVVEDVNKSLGPLIEDFIEENDILLEKYDGDAKFSNVGSGDKMWVFRKKRGIGLTLFQKIANILSPLKGKK